MADFKVRVVNNITKEYPQMIKVVVYKQPHIFTYSDSRKRKSVEVDDKFYDPKISSINRTKTLLHDLVLCNDFELFATFTFNPAKVDSFNYNRCLSVMSRWLHHQRDKATSKGKDFKYLIVPEMHKSGRWHFHALISGYSSTLKLSPYKTDTLRPIYNITSFRSGFTTASLVDSKEALSNYVTKYITKDFIRNFNRKRFLCSKNLVRPVKSVNSPILSLTLPIFRHKVAESKDTFEYLLDL